MVLVFISGWAVDSGLSRSTVHPHLAQLATYESVERILYLSIEPRPCDPYREDSGKVLHAPIVKRSHSRGLVSRVIDQIATRKSVLDHCEQFKPDIGICRGAQAGALGHVIWKKYAIPYYVESFEPHANYMVESGVWSRYGIKYFVQRNWESKIKRTAAGMITVSASYANYLTENELISPERLRTVPCWVDGETFGFDSDNRESIRRELHVGDSLVCVYLGQFGGLYYDLEAFNALRVLRDTIQKPVHFLLLTPTNHQRVEHALSQQGLHKSECSVLYVDHADIAGYLSAADFAISFHRAIPMAFSYSPIKYGEYWSCGLPVIAPARVGDDSMWIDNDGLGCTVDFLDEYSIKRSAEKILALLAEPLHRESIRSKGTLRRGKEALVNVYDEILSRSMTYYSHDSAQVKKTHL
jgi:glycosyltransferase involved in cell wall biosynthesis